MYFSPGVAKGAGPSDLQPLTYCIHLLRRLVVFVLLPHYRIYVNTQAVVVTKQLAGKYQHNKGEKCVATGGKTLGIS